MVAKFSIFDPCEGPSCTSGAILKKLSLITDFRLLSPSYKNQSIDLPRKLIAWFLYRKAVFHGETKYYDAPFYILSLSQDGNKASAELLLLSILTFLQEKFTRGSFFIKIIDQQIAILQSKIQLQIFFGGFMEAWCGCFYF